MAFNPKELFDKHLIADQDRFVLGTFIATGQGPVEVIQDLMDRPNYAACVDDALVQIFQPFADAVAAFHAAEEGP